MSENSFYEFLPFMEEKIADASAALQSVDLITQIIILVLTALLTVGLFVFTFSMIKLMFVFIFKVIKGVFTAIFARSKSTAIPTENKAPSVSNNTSEYFCSNCGSKFSDRMLLAIKSNHKAHCEGCGQGFMVAH